MSWEGHQKTLCANGHLEISYDQGYPLGTWTCHDCGAPAAWSSQVDETNGPDKSTGLCPGDVKLRVRRLNRCTCKQCGVQHQAQPVQYFIPQDGRRIKPPRLFIAL